MPQAWYNQAEAYFRLHGVTDPVQCSYGLVMFIFEKNPKNLQKPVKYTLPDGTVAQLDLLLGSWPNVSFRDLAKFLGQLNSMHPVLKGLATLRSKMLQLIVNVRHFETYPWEGKVLKVSKPVLEKAEQELQFWNA